MIGCGDDKKQSHSYLLLRASAKQSRSCSGAIALFPTVIPQSSWGQVLER